ncbi:MAG: carbohydrate ABC transporter permease [Anaerolineae bacterium]|nr:carbohydrate ABC transporter permease [Anaerolineae bacterium]
MGLLWKRSGQAGSPLRRRRRRVTWLARVARALLHLVIASGAFMVMIPFLWMVSASLKELRQIFAYPPIWIPNPVRWDNYATALVTPQHPFIPLYFANSLYVALLGGLGELLSCSLVGFGFARLRFPGRNVLFLVVLGTMAVPYYVVMLPRYILFRQLQWLDSYRPLIVPPFLATNAFAIFLFRQFFTRVSPELLDAARLDGTSTWGAFVRVVAPLSRPAFATVAILGFTGRWNDYLAPLLYLNKLNLYTVSIGLAYFRLNMGGWAVIDWGPLMAASTTVMLPCILVFFLFQRVFIQGVVITGVKG